MEITKFQRKKNLQLHECAASAQTVKPVPPTGQTGLHGIPTRTPVRPVDRPVRPVWQKQRAAHLALKCATRRLPNLRVSLHDLPPLCIPADELDTTGAEVDVLGS